jgi:hypothetical protein
LIVTVIGMTRTFTALAEQPAQAVPATIVASGVQAAVVVAPLSILGIVLLILALVLFLSR